MRIYQIALAATFGGLAVVAVSLAWPAPSAKDYWDEQQEAEFSKAIGRVRSLAHRYAESHGKNPELKRALDEAQEELSRHNQQFESAQSRSALTPTVLHWLGILVAITGVGVWYWKRPREE